MTMDPISWIAAAGALGAVLGLILMAGKLARHAGLAPQAGKRLRVEESVALDTRRRLILVRCDERSLLLLTGGTQDQIVGWLP